MVLAAVLQCELVLSRRSDASAPLKGGRRGRHGVGVALAAPRNVRHSGRRRKRRREHTVAASVS